MALKTDTYMFPLINKFRDAFAETFSYAERDGMTLIETVKSHTADGAEVTFALRNWKYNTPNTWCGVPFDSRMVDTIRGSRNTYECYFKKSHAEGSPDYLYTVECRTLAVEEAPTVPESPEGDVNFDGVVDYKDFMNLNGVEDYNYDGQITYEDYVMKYDNKNAVDEEGQPLGIGTIGEEDGDFNGDGWVDDPRTVTPNPIPEPPAPPEEGGGEMEPKPDEGTETNPDNGTETEPVSGSETETPAS